MLFKSDFEVGERGFGSRRAYGPSGQFSVKEISGIELPGSPLEDFGALFGPAESDGVAVRHAFVPNALSGSYSASALV